MQVSRISLHPKYDKIHAHGPCKSPRSKAPNRSSRARAKTDNYTTFLSMRSAFNTLVDSSVSKSPEVYSVDASTLTEREVNRELKKLYGRSWQKVKAGHPHYALNS
jgi:post-segregation antitoxin (ccd killing protein)